MPPPVPPAPITILLTKPSGVTYTLPAAPTYRKMTPTLPPLPDTSLLSASPIFMVRTPRSRPKRREGLPAHVPRRSTSSGSLTSVASVGSSASSSSSSASSNSSTSTSTIGEVELNVSVPIVPRRRWWAAEANPEGTSSSARTPYGSSPPRGSSAHLSNSADSVDPAIPQPFLSEPQSSSDKASTDESSNVDSSQDESSNADDMETVAADVTEETNEQSKFSRPRPRRRQRPSLTGTPRLAPITEAGVLEPLITVVPFSVGLGSGTYRRSKL